MTTSWTRRQTLLGALGGLGIAATAAACSRGSSTAGSTDSSGNSTQLQVAWWGNEVRDAQTSEAIDLYMSQTPGLAIEPMPAEFGAYWDRMATQTAGGDMPDVTQFGDGFLAEYATRGALLDLEPYIDTSKFAPGTVDVGRVEGTLVGINIGINTPTLMCNLSVLEQAGLDLPDDKTWTWDDYLDLATQISTATPDGVFGTMSPGAEGVLRAWVRQHGGELFTEDGQLGTTVDVLEGYFDLLARFAASGAMPEASQIVEDNAKPIEESPVVVGSMAFQLVWSNQFTVVSNSADGEIAMLRMPSVTGNEADLQAWYHPSQLWCASASSENPEAAGAFIDWWVNSTDVGELCLDERGRPCNTEVLAAIEPMLAPEGQAVSQFLADLEPALGAPQPVPPPGSGQVLGDILARTQDDLYFGDIDAATAAQQFYDESEVALAGG